MPTFLSPAKPVSTPTGEDVAEDLQPFYSQVLEWEDCGEGLSCATATAPLASLTVPVVEPVVYAGNKPPARIMHAKTAQRDHHTRIVLS